MRIDKVKPTRKEQPKADLLVAAAKIVEALYPLHSFADRRKVLIAALAIVSEETLLNAVRQT